MATLLPLHPAKSDLNCWKAGQELSFSIRYKQQQQRKAPTTNVGIGTTNTEFAKLTIVNPSGSGVTTALYVQGESRFIGTMTVGAALTVKGQFLSNFCSR